MKSLAASSKDEIPAAWPGTAPIPEGYSKRTTPKPISILGCTGSIGTQTLDICREHPESFEVKALSAGSNVELLLEQIKEFKPELVSIQEAKLGDLREALSASKSELGGYSPEVVAGVDGMCEVAAFPSVEATVTGIVGCAGLQPTVAAIKAGKDICLANKETLIAGGPFVLPLAKEHGIHILPADSEHSGSREHQ